MADFEYFDDQRVHGAHHDRGDAPSRVGSVMNWAGAIVSLGLVVGMGVWAFQLTMRDVSGVPVIRALEGPMRVPPADPGGTQAAHQGLAVNRIAEGAEAAPAPDRVVLAPPPVELEAVALSLASASASSYAETRGPDAASGSAIGADTEALIERLLDQANAGRAPEAAADPMSAAPAEAATETAALASPGPQDAIPVSVPGVARSLRPASRPAEIVTRVRAAAPAAEAAPRNVREIDAAGLPEGTRLVQLGAFDTPEIARSEWERLTARFPDFFDGRARVIQEASSGGAAFYRLRAHGFDDLAASRRFCAALMAQNAPCIPVTVR
jgi:hypothetical protein